MPQIDFHAFIVPTDGPSVLTNWKGASAAAWQIEHASSLLVVKIGIAFSRDAASDESEALILALLEVLKETEEGKFLELYCRQEWVCKIINRLAKVRKYKALWNAFDEILIARMITIHATHVPKKSDAFADHFEQLRVMAVMARDSRSRQLGHPTGGFSEIPDTDS